MSKPVILVNGEPLAGPLPLFQRWGRDGVRDGRKTQTRRIVKPPAPWVSSDAGIEVLVARWLRCPYGQAGEIRYLREPLCRDVLHGRYVAIYDDVQRPVTLARHILGGAVIAWRWKRNTLSSMHMPREAARTFVKFTDIRCERVQDISHEDARAEGVRGDIAACITVRAEFAAMWDRIHGEGAWGRNDWVFVPAWEPLDSPKVEVQS